MLCENCGLQIQNSGRCPYCDAPVNNYRSRNTNVNTGSSYFGKLNKGKRNGRTCPKCGGTDFDVAVYSDTKTTGKDYSVGQGCLGYLLLGPLGILCGMCGQGRKTETTHKTYHVCKRCGEKIRNRDELVQEIETHKLSARNLLIISGVLFVILLFIGVACMDVWDTLGITFIVVDFIIMPIMALGSLVDFAKAKEKSEELERIKW